MADTGRFKDGARSLAPRAQVIGRVALWVLVALLLIRGLGAILASPETASTGEPGKSSRVLDDRSSAFVVQFARAYFRSPGPDGVARFMAEAASPPIRASRSPGQKVTQAEVVETSWLDQSRAVSVVACELSDGRVLHLAVPLVRAENGGAAVLGAPYLVPGPEPGDATGEDTEPVSGPDSGAINELVNKFLAAYVSTDRPTDLAYFLTPESEVRPLGGRFTLAGKPRTTQLDGGPTARTVVAAVRVVDEAGGSSHSAGYRLDLVKRERWYVDAIQGVER